MSGMEKPGGGLARIIDLVKLKKEFDCGTCITGAWNIGSGSQFQKACVCSMAMQQNGISGYLLSNHMHCRREKAPDDVNGAFC